MNTLTINLEAAKTIQYRLEGVPVIDNPALLEVTSGFWQNVTMGIDCELVKKGGQVYLVSNNPKAIVGSANLMTNRIKIQEGRQSEK